MTKELPATVQPLGLTPEGTYTATINLVRLVPVSRRATNFCTEVTIHILGINRGEILYVAGDMVREWDYIQTTNPQLTINVSHRKSVRLKDVKYTVVTLKEINAQPLVKSNVARDGIEAQRGLNDIFPGDDIL